MHCMLLVSKKLRQRPEGILQDEKKWKEKFNALPQGLKQIIVHKCIPSIENLN